MARECEIGVSYQGAVEVGSRSKTPQPTTELVLQICYNRRTMTEVASRELRNNTASLLRRVQAGERIVVTARGKPVASLVPFENTRRKWLPRRELVSRLAAIQADAGLRKDLARLAGDTTDDLGPLR